MKNITLLAVTALSLAAVSPALAKGGPMQAFDFATIDANGDGNISKDEMENLPNTMFAKIDTNKDGTISSEEFETHAIERAKQNSAAKFKKHDANNDGKISADEMKPKNAEKMTKRFFKHVDENDDGMISQAEFDAAKEKMEKRHKKGRWKDHNDTEEN